MHGSDMPFVAGSAVRGFSWAEQQQSPVYLGVRNRSGRHAWIYDGEIYTSEHRLTVDEVRALVNQEARRLRAVVSAAVAAESNTGAVPGRAPIPDDVKIFVWQRDQGRCVSCGSIRNLEFDHVIPIAKGGSNTARNLQILCEACNRAKSANLV
jgi:hypothetical protein